MKKITILIFFLVIIFGISGCKSTIETVATTKNEEITTIETITSITTTKKSLPTYTPGSIKIDHSEDFCDEDEAYFKRSYRLCYYKIPNSLIDAAGQAGIDYLNEFFKEVHSKEIHEMFIVSLIKSCEMPKDVFEKIILEEKKANIENGHDLTQEQYELPNADIIYTFDNEIINEYYRRE